MNIALLFNTNAELLGYSYGRRVRDMILSTKVLQDSNRHLKISVGDVLIEPIAREEYCKFCEWVYFWHPWHRLQADKLRGTYLQENVFGWVIENVTHAITEKLHKALLQHPSYLGLHEVDFAYPLHLVVYRNSMIPLYRIKGMSCHMYFGMGEEDSKDEGEMEDLKQYGFTQLVWENSGARRTIFDDYDTEEHFKRIDDFKSAVANHLDDGMYEASELVLFIEDVNPKLFNALGAAVKALSSAKTEEDFAHVGLSSRRFMEQLADVVFPARTEEHNGRKVGNAEFKNRLWAFVADNLGAEAKERIQEVGGEVDRLWDESNRTLHSNADYERAMKCLVDIAKLSAILLNLKPVNEYDPYYAYAPAMEKFWNELRRRNAS